MASGDAQRVWFPDLIAIVRQAGNPAMSMDALLRLRDRLDASLQTLRQTRQLLPAMMWCPHCQARHRAAPPSVSVRARSRTSGLRIIISSRKPGKMPSYHAIVRGFGSCAATHVTGTGQPVRCLLSSWKDRGSS